MRRCTRANEASEYSLARTSANRSRHVGQPLGIVASHMLHAEGVIAPLPNGLGLERPRHLAQATQAYPQSVPKPLKSRPSPVRCKALLGGWPSSQRRSRSTSSAQNHRGR